MGFWENRRVVVTGGHGFLGSFVVEKLRASGAKEVVVPRSKTHDLRIQTEALRLFTDSKPDIFIHLAAVVGGIGANRENPGRFFYDNAIMGINAIEAARITGRRKIRLHRHHLFLPQIHSRPFSAKTSSGTAIPKKPTPPTASPRKCCSFSCSLTASNTVLTASI